MQLSQEKEIVIHGRTWIPAEGFATEHADLLLENEQAYHLLYGLTDGIPLCCVLFWCSCTDIFEQDWSVHEFETMKSKEELNGSQYALCPECMIRELSK